MAAKRWVFASTRARKSSRLQGKNGVRFAYVKDYASYNYDPATNRLTNITTSGGAVAQGFTYDAQGNVNTRNGASFEFSFGNRLRSFNGQEGYRYDALGRRVLAWRASGGSTLSMYTRGGEVAYLWSEPTQRASDNIYLNGSLVAVRERAFADDAITLKYQHTDALGSPVATTNQAGTVIDRTSYEPYGKAIGETLDGVGYTGHVMDPVSGLVYMQQRYYDPAIGRFLSVDPVTTNPNTGAMFNRYNYANNNPYRFIDPDGRLAELPGTCQRINVCLGKSGGSSRAEADQQRQYKAAQADPSKRDAFVSRMHMRNGLSGVTPTYDPNETSLGSYDELAEAKRIGPRAFEFPNAADVGSVLVHEGNHEKMAKLIPDFTRLKHTNARTVIEHNAHSAELMVSSPFLSRLSRAYLEHTRSEISGNYDAASPANRKIIGAGMTCANAFCSGE